MFPTIRLAINALRRNILRSALTTLGIVIGIAAVIAMVEIGQGASRAVEKTIQSMGSDIVIIYPSSSRSGVVRGSSGTSTKLTLHDAEALDDPERCPSIKAMAPIVRAREQIVNPANGKNCNPWNLYGTTPTFLEIRDWANLAEGEPFTEADDDRCEQVCILGQTLVRDLFDGESPIGRQLRIKGLLFKVIGVLTPKGANMMGMDQDDIILAPLRTIKFKVSGQSVNALAAAVKPDPSTQVNTLTKLYPSTDHKLYPDVVAAQLANNPQLTRSMNIDQILIQSRSQHGMTQTIEEVREVLRERHRLHAEEEDTFVVRDMAEISKALGSTSNMMSMLLLMVATISLVVGGVGIMNIMLVSVTERTREIGLRMAVGARSRDILKQFLVESTLLCTLGGILGIVLGRTISWLVWVFMNWATEVSIPAMVGAVGVSLVVGIVFGFYPAWKASRLDPIEALRYE